MDPPPPACPVGDQVAAGGARPYHPIMGHYEDEIAAQPATLRRLLDEGRGEVLRAAEAIRAYAPAFVLVAARGSSDNAARYAQYLLGERNGAVVALAAPSLFTLYGAHPSLRGALVVGISQSGRSPDVVAVLAEARRQGALTLALTNADESPLRAAAQHHVALRAGLERAVPASKTYTAQLLATAMLSAAWAGEPLDELEGVPDLVRDALHVARPAARGARFLAAAQRLVVVGRGYTFGTAFEIALKVKETCRVIAEPHSLADFLHGPVAMLEPGLPVLMVAPSSKADDDHDALRARLAEGGALIAAISDRPAVLDAAAVAVPIPAGTPEHLTPLPCAVAGHLLSLELARARGLDPDAPPGLRKITETR